MPREKRVFAALFLGLIALHVGLLLSARLYPFTDLPDHLAAATIARHIGERTNDFSEFYRVDAFLEPNTFHLWFCSLPIFPSAEAANRAFFAIYAVLLPFSVLLALRKLGGNPWYAFLSFLFVYNYSVSWGFVGFAFAVPLVIFFCLFFVFDERGVTGVPRVLGAAGALVLLYFVHVLAALFCLLVMMLHLARHGGRSGGRGRTGSRALLSSIAAAVPLAVLVLSWWRREVQGYPGPGLGPFLLQYYSTSFVPALFKRKSVLIFDNYHLFNGVWGYAVAAVFSIGIIVPTAAALLSRRRTAPGVPAFILAVLLCCLLLPNELPQQSVLYERFAVLLFLALVIFAGSRAPARLPRPAAGAFVALALVHFVLWTNYFFDFNRENAGFDRAFLRPDGSGKKLAGLVIDYTYRGRPTYIHFPSYYIVWERGVATASLVDFRFGPVRRNASTVSLPRYLEWAGKRGNYDGRYRDMDYLLMRGGRVPEGFVVERTAGEWRLCARVEAPESEESGASATP